MEAANQVQETQETARLRVTVTFDVEAPRGAVKASATLAQVYEQALQKDPSSLVKQLNEGQYTVNVQARRNRKPKTTTTTAE